MSQRDNFVGGFLTGAVVGGVIGGIVGVLVTSRVANQDTINAEESFTKLEGQPLRGRKKQLPTEQSMEVARRGLEDKIAQLNKAIDDVRQQLGSVNGTSKPESERAIAPDP